MKKINIFLTCLLFTACGSGIESGSGKKIGQIVKIGEHGMICRTYEAEIIRGGFNNGSGVSGAKLDFSIVDKKLFEDLTNVMENQEEIELKYSKRMFSGICYADELYVATGFKVLNKENLKKENKE